MLKKSGSGSASVKTNGSFIFGTKKNKKEME